MFGKSIGKKLLVLLIFSLYAPTFARASLTSRINSIINRKSQKKVCFAVKVINAKTGKTLYARNADKPMIPASNMKIITSAAALEYLGPDYEFTTRVGLLEQTLAVIGGGDPLLGDDNTDKKHNRAADWIINDIIATLKAARITSLNGIIIDSTFFDDNRVHPNWPRDQLNRPYACEVSGLNYNCNCVRITTKNTGGKVGITIQPQTGYVRLVNKVVPTSRGNSAVGAYRNTTPNKLTIKGKCTKQAGFDVAIESPAEFFGFVLAEKLAAAGIEVTGKLEGRLVRNDSRINILKTYSSPIADVLSRCNKDSLGLAAEALVKTISAENSGRLNGSWPHGLNLIKQYLIKLGIDPGEFNLDDGSGLSKENKLSPNAVTKVFLDIYKSQNRGLYIESLAVGGSDGTIAKYFEEAKYKGRILGKTGYVKLAKSFSGVSTTADGDYIFSILTTGANGRTRTAINDIAKAIIDNAK
ncbi:MAG TPA: D-alanyl-D-alanine carboxypeptidase/D-alanyl-D-alanine-endopeptidase [Planctomycetes bacterium]|nr:D-alanyl-D-alanine carboxypeptidase/D-alanyl-D-alanine-endopeptidase [Planctomycetota bacterium]HIJ70075.1 D-alanyl-D-alanine carboxypeptidase/D-alanyl-D-alanine-endopeptidase [Planctomycetota bacterium]